MTGVAYRVSARAHDVARFSFIALGFSIPISVAMDGVLSAVAVLAWLLAARFRETAAAIRNNPVAVLACVWFFAHLLGALYSIGEAKEITRTVGKAAMFLLIPIAIVVLKDPRDREHALYAFMAAIALTTVLSCLRWSGLIPADAPLLKSAVFSAAVVFKYHLTQNLLLALGAFLFAVYADRVTSSRWRIVLAGFSALTVINVFIMGDGRTGQVVLMLLLLYYGAWRLGRRGLVTALSAGLVMGAAAYVLPDTGVHKRTALALSEASEWEPGIAAARPSSVGERLEFYRRSLHIVSAHPVIGVGSGGFIAAYESAVRNTDSKPTHNPHNEYLLQAVELGVPGFVLLAAMFGILWHAAGRLSDRDHAALARALAITFAVASLASSTLNDHTESLLFIWMSGVLFAGLASRERRQAKGRSVNHSSPSATSAARGAVRPKLSAIVIAMNNEATIGRCIASLAWADEIVVVDSGSTDRTPEICRELGARVHVTADWPGHGAQKNRALDLANGEWVLSIDSDEWVTPELRAEIEQALAASDAASGYALPRRSSFCGRFMRHSGWWPDYVVRLIRRDAGRFTGDPVHERLLVTGRVARLRAPVLHEAITDLDQMLAKMNGYSTSSARMKLAQGKRTSLFAAVLHGGWAFVRTYVLRAGFLDGREGFMLAVANAEGSYYRYVKLMMLTREDPVPGTRGEHRG